MKNIILTVQPSGNGKFRLGISLSDSKNIFKKRGVAVQLYLTEIKIFLKTTCGLPIQKGFDLSKKELSDWICNNGFNKYKKGKPIKLNFKLSISRETFILRYISKVENS